MAIDLTQKDLRITNPNYSSSTAGKVTLALSSTGDIQLVSGKDKLSEQLLRAIVNDNTVSSGIALNNTALSTRHINTLFTLILRKFRQSQIYDTQLSDPRVIGFAIYRFDQYVSSRSFVRASTDPITWAFDDLSLNNGFTYTYGITKMYQLGYESSILEQLNVMPSQFSNNQNPVIGKFFAAIPGDKSVTFYVDYNRVFKQSELLEAIENILILQDPTEPRRYTVTINIRNLLGNALSLSNQRISITK